MRRFYFDDGSSRKRWQVEVKGKAQTVAYGRLTGKLRESKKTFKSPAEATEQTAKLIAKKKREGYIEVNPARLSIVRAKSSRKATEKQIEALEKQIDHTLPEEYRSFLRAYNGGRPNPDHLNLYRRGRVEDCWVETLLHLPPAKPESQQINFQIVAWEDVIEGHVPIARGGGDLITLSLETKTFGAVYWWCHEIDEPGQLLASSFDEFLTRIAVVEGDDEEPEEAVPGASGATEKKPKATVRGLLKLVRRRHTPETIKAMEQMVKELGDLSVIEDGTWPGGLFESPGLLRCLLEAGLNPELTDTNGNALLLKCSGSRECIDVLAEYGPRIDRRSGDRNETALMLAVMRGEIPAVERLLDLGANPTVPRLNLTDPSGDGKKVRKLIEKARAKWRKSGGWKKKVQEARARRAAADTGGKDGPEPTIELLLQRMDRPYLSDECDDVEELEGLIEAIGDLSGIRDVDWPVVGLFESPRVLYALLEAGLNPEIADKEGSALLCQCVTHPDCIGLLLERGVELDRRSGPQDRTALMEAAYRGCADSVEVLLNTGANPTLEFEPGSKFLPGLYNDMFQRIVAARKEWRAKSAMTSRVKKATVNKKK